MRRALTAIAAMLATACAPALREPPTIDVLARATQGALTAGTARDWFAQADASFERRPDPVEVSRAEQLYLLAAATESSRIDGVVGAVRAKVWLVEHERDAKRREQLAVSAVQTAQWCSRRAPDDPSCDYWLAVALGVQARERRSTADQGLKEMVAALRRAGERAGAIDHAGPHRVLALVLLRAPGWPLGPGDPDEALEEARRAVSLDPGYPPNEQVLAEALGRTGDREGSRDAWRRSAESARASTDPDAADWLRDAEIALRKP